MELKLAVKPLSVNVAWRGGPRYRTKDYLAFEKELSYLLPNKHLDAKEFEIHYTFYIKNYGRTDVDNLIKPVQDILVKKGIIPDDRKIVFISAAKVRAKKDSITINIIAIK